MRWESCIDNIGKTNLPVKNVSVPGLSFDNNPCMVTKDINRIMWKATLDLPNGFKCTNVLISCQDERSVVDDKRYMVVDLTSVESPITYIKGPPTGGWTEEFMTTKLVLRRIDPQSYYMGSVAAEPDHQTNEDYHKVTLTKPFYIGIFELTEKQFALVCGGAGEGSKPVEKSWAEIRGEDVLRTETIKEVAKTGMPLSASFYGGTFNIDQTTDTSGFAWPNENAVAGDSFMGKLRSKTGLNFDLPTEAQWECACRGGSSQPLNIGVTNSSENISLIVGPPKLAPGAVTEHYIYVGNYMPNAYGIYDMAGNLAEWCLDIYQVSLGFEDQTDPIGSAFAVERVLLFNKKEISFSWHSTGQSYLKYDGTDYFNTYAGMNWSSAKVEFTYNASGVRRVVRGGDSRSASRTSVVNLNSALPILNTGLLHMRSGSTAGLRETIKPSFQNKRYGVRVTLTLN